MKKYQRLVNYYRSHPTWLLLLVLLHFNGIAATAQGTHPHILANPSDKAIILEKIKQQPWANTIFEEMRQHIQPYADRHQTNPEWILSRYLMNRVPGKRYTQFFSDEEGTQLVRYAGDAPHPTVRVSPHKRPPITRDGFSYKMPAIEELVPYDTSTQMLLQSNKPGAAKEWVNPQSFVDKINGNINQLALDAAILYWLTGNTRYATFAADILSQWARGAFYQQPIEGPCRTGFLSIQTLGDGNHEPMALAYDFLYDYLRQQQYTTSWYETVFEKIAHTMTFRGYWNNNWFAAQTPALVFAALSLEDNNKRAYYLDYYLNRDTINGSCGHLGLPSVVKKWLTPDGHWKEPGGYHNYPVSSLLVSAMAMEKNGYAVFEKHPALFEASYVLLKYSFPNFIAPSMGDTGPASQSPECLEIGIAMAKKYNLPVVSQLTAAMEVLISNKWYQRTGGGWLGLLTYLPELPAQTGAMYAWPRSGELDFAKCYLQRNGTNNETGLMYLIQGATYNHNHANGMAMELYGAGTVMGPDPGKGLTYEAPMHVQYYAQWSAHNTVVAGGQSASVPYFKGGGGTKKMGEIKLSAMEPLAGKEAVSALCSFTDTRYTDISTNTQQHRTMAIIRTSPVSGYYVDIFRSGNTYSNDYLYHNIGSGLQLLNSSRQSLAVAAATLPLHSKPADPPGLRIIRDLQSTGKTDAPAIGLFTIPVSGEANRFMQVLFAGAPSRTFYAGKAPATGTADKPYRELPTPTLICRQEGEAWRRPFIAIYEPFSGESNYTVEQISLEDIRKPGEFSAVQVISKQQSRQVILQSLNSQQLYTKGAWKFRGQFGVISLKGDQPEYLYLGDGNEIAWGSYSLSCRQPHSAANLQLLGDQLIISCHQPTLVRIGKSKAKQVVLIVAGKRQELLVITTADGISFEVPPVINASLLIQ